MVKVTEETLGITLECSYCGVDISYYNQSNRNEHLAECAYRANQKLEQDNADLIHDVEKYVRIAADHRTMLEASEQENACFRRALEEIHTQGHTNICAFITDTVNGKCDCVFRIARTALKTIQNMGEQEMPDISDISGVRE